MWDFWCWSICSAFVLGENLSWFIMFVLILSAQFLCSTHTPSWLPKQQVYRLLKLLKFSEIKGVKSLAWKSGCVQISCLPQHHCHHKSRCQYHSEKRISSPNLTGTHYQGVPPSIAFEMIIINLALVIGCQRCFENFGFLRHSWLFACVQT